MLRRGIAKTAIAFLRIGDFVLVLASFLFAWYLRFELQVIPLKKDFQPLAEYLFPIVVVAIIWMLVFLYRRVYSRPESVSFAEESGRIFWSSVFAIAIPMVLVFLYRSYSYSRLVLGFGGLLSFVSILIFHRLTQHFLRQMLLRGQAASRKLIIGSGAHAANVFECFRSNPLIKSGLLGCLRTGDLDDSIPKQFIIGNLDDLRQILIDNVIDEVILAGSNLTEKTIQKIIYECRIEKVLFEMVPNFHELLRGDIRLNRVDSISMLSFTDLTRTQGQRIVKRAFDLLVSGLLILAISPLLILIAISILLDSRGAVFFTQKRIGRNGRRFKMFKFRSMRRNAEKQLDDYIQLNEVDGAMFKIRKDPRITRVGSIIRRFSLDELPQLFNVFRGEMSLVGPRPTIERELEKYDRWQLKRIDTIPGMTGLWQVSGRSDLPFEKMIQLDIYYIEKWSLWLDFKILVMTIPAVLTGKGAY